MEVIKNADVSGEANSASKLLPTSDQELKVSSTLKKMQQISPIHEVKNKRIAVSLAVKQEKLLKAMMDRNVDVERAIKRYHREWKSKYGQNEEEKPSASPDNQQSA